MLILGHRGAILDHAPFYQNSLRAFQEALSYSDGFETDACMDAEGEIFLIHEAKYVDPLIGVEYCAHEHLDPKRGASLERRTTDQCSITTQALNVRSPQSLGSQRLDQLTTREALSLRLKDGSPLPTLHAALTLTGEYPGKLIDIELKAYGVAEPVLKIVRQALSSGTLKPEAILISSFNHPALKLIRTGDPGLKTGAIFLGPDQPSVPLFPWQSESTGFYTPFLASELQSALMQEIKPDYIVIPQELLRQTTLDLIEACLPQAQVMAWVFTEKNNFDPVELWTRLEPLRRSRKIAGLMVDNPRQFCAAYAAQIRAI